MLRLSFHISDLMTIDNLSEQPLSQNILDGNNETCFGFENRQVPYYTQPIRVVLNSTNMFNSFLKVVLDQVMNCTEFHGQILVSTGNNGNEACPSQKQCSLVSNEILDSMCTVNCPCVKFPCEIYVIFTVMSNAKVCEITYG